MTPRSLVHAHRFLEPLGPDCMFALPYSTSSDPAHFHDSASTVFFLFPLRLVDTGLLVNAQ